MLWQEHLCNYIRRFGYFGAFRFKLLNFLYHLTENHSRAAEYDFILPYLAPVGNTKVRVIDVGASHSLFIYELYARGYVVAGTDQRPFQERIRQDIAFVKCDIGDFPAQIMQFDIATCISVIEHVGAGEYGDKIDPQGDYKMIKKISEILRQGGMLLLTCPTKDWTGKNFKQKIKTICRGYDYQDLEALTKEWFKITRHEIRRGQHCLALVRR